MSEVGHFGDHAPAEGFFGMLKRERVNRCRYRTLAGARADVFDYIERFHNSFIQCRLDALDRKFSVFTQLSAKTGRTLTDRADGRDPLIAMRYNIVLILLVGFGFCPHLWCAERILKAGFEGGLAMGPLQVGGVPAGWSAFSSFGAGNGSNVPIDTRNPTLVWAVSPTQPDVILAAISTTTTTVSLSPTTTAVAAILGLPPFVGLKHVDVEVLTAQLLQDTTFGLLIARVSNRGGLDVEDPANAALIAQVISKITPGSSGLTSTVKQVYLPSNPKFTVSENFLGFPSLNIQPLTSTRHAAEVLLEPTDPFEVRNFTQVVSSNFVVPLSAARQASRIDADTSTALDDLIGVALEMMDADISVDAPRIAAFPAVEAGVLRAFSGFGRANFPTNAPQAWRDAADRAVANNLAAALVAVVVNRLESISPGGSSSPSSCFSAIRTALRAAIAREVVALGLSGRTSSDFASVVYSIVASVYSESLSVCVADATSTQWLGKLMSGVSVALRSVPVAGQLIIANDLSPAILIGYSAMTSPGIQSFVVETPNALTELEVIQVQHEGNSYSPNGLRIQLQLVQDVPLGTRYRVCNQTYARCITIERTNFFGAGSVNHKYLYITDGLVGYPNELVPVCYEFEQLQDFGSLCVHRPDPSVQSNLVPHSGMFFGQQRANTASPYASFISINFPVGNYNFVGLNFNSNRGLAELGFLAGGVSEYLSAPTLFGIHPLCAGQLEVIAANVHEFTPNFVRFSGHSYQLRQALRQAQICLEFVRSQAIDFRVDFNPLHFSSVVQVEGARLRVPVDLRSRFSYPLPTTTLQRFSFYGPGFRFVEETPYQ